MLDPPGTNTPWWRTERKPISSTSSWDELEMHLGLLVAGRVVRQPVALVEHVNRAAAGALPRQRNGNGASGSRPAAVAARTDDRVEIGHGRERAVDSVHRQRRTCA